MIPEFEAGMKAMLVERKDRPGLLGVYVRGGRLVCPLPDGYDGETSLTVYQGWVLVAHPKLPPLMCDPSTGATKLIDDAHVVAKPGRMKLVTH